MRIVVSLLLALALPWSVSASQGVPPGDVQASGQDGLRGPGALPPSVVGVLDGWREPLDRFRADLRSDVAADDVGGITAGVMIGHRLVWAEGFGWADRDRRIPAGVETIYRTGSISKPVTALVLAQLADRGILELDDPVAHHLPEASGFRDPPEGGASITLRQLATHTSGLMREPELEGAAAGPIEEWERKVLQSIPHTGFLAPPGQEVSYSNIGFGTLGLTVSRAEGRSLLDQVEEGIFRPLGMGSSHFVVPPEATDRLAVGYRNRPDGSIDAELPALEHRGRGYKVPNGGVYSTVGDMVRLMAAMSGHATQEFLSDTMRDEVLRLQTPGDGDAGYGLGFSIRRLDSGTELVGHGGSVAGYTAYLLFEPERGVGVVLLRNYNSGATNLGGAAREFLEALLRELDGA
jgi:CubicO group peptidase (beta-lactamase class C family)